MRSNTLFLGFALCTSALAADDVVTMFLPDNEKGQPFAGKVLGSVRLLVLYLSYTNH